jgi:hypothetical protein
MQRPINQSDADDRKDTAWLRETLAVCGIAVLCGIALVTVQSTTQMTTVAMYMGDSVNQASP